VILWPGSEPEPQASVAAGVISRTQSLSLQSSVARQQGPLLQSKCHCHLLSECMHLLERQCNVICGGYGPGARGQAGKDLEYREYHHCDDHRIGAGGPAAVDTSLTWSVQLSLSWKLGTLQAVCSSCPMLRLCLVFKFKFAPGPCFRLTLTLSRLGRAASFKLPARTGPA
jgi:hypothetical protein